MGKIKEKLSEGWEKTKKKGVQTLEWMQNNPELTIALTPVALAAIGGGAKVIRGISRKNDLRRQKLLKELYVYDHSNGVYIRVKHPLSGKEAATFSKLRRSGCTVSEALEKMRLIK